MLKYFLRKNLLTAPEDYTAQIIDSQVFTLDDVIDRMIKKGAALTRTDLTAILNLYMQECSVIIKEGGRLNTPLMNTSMSISGVFKGADDTFDKKRHRVNLDLKTGQLLQDAVLKVKCKKTENTNAGPYSTDIADILSFRLGRILL